MTNLGCEATQRENVPRHSLTLTHTRHSLTLTHTHARAHTLAHTGTLALDVSNS